MDVKEKITEVISKISKDPKMLENFKKDPKSVVTGILGSVLDDDALSAIVEGVKAKLGADKLSETLGSLGKLFGKK